MDEILKIKREVTDEMLGRAPELAYHTEGEMRTELGRELVDRISDGNLYAVLIQTIAKPAEDCCSMQYTKTMELKRSVFCKNCIFGRLDGNPEIYCTRWNNDVPLKGFCFAGQERGGKI